MLLQPSREFKLDVKLAAKKTIAGVREHHKILKRSRVLMMEENEKISDAIFKSPSWRFHTALALLLHTLRASKSSTTAQAREIFIEFLRSQSQNLSWTKIYSQWPAADLLEKIRPLHACSIIIRLLINYHLSNIEGNIFLQLEHRNEVN